MHRGATVAHADDGQELHAKNAQVSLLRTMDAQNVSYFNVYTAYFDGNVHGYTVSANRDTYIAAPT